MEAVIRTLREKSLIRTQKAGSKASTKTDVEAGMRSSRLKELHIDIDVIHS